MTTRRASSALAYLAALLFAVAAFVFERPVFAQFPMGPSGGSGFGAGAQPGSGGFGGAPGGAQKKKGSGKQAPAGDETHAAGTPEGAQSLQTQEPSLPQDPTAIPPDMKKRLGSSADTDVERGLGPTMDRLWAGPWYQEKSGKYQFRTAFPLWAERKMPNDRASLFGFYYNRRSTDIDSDVLFPVFWRLRDQKTYTTIVGPFAHRERERGPQGPARHDNWLAPIFFEGSSEDGSGYFHAPLVFTFTQHTSHSGLNVAGPAYCAWKGGSTCDTRTAEKIDLGVAPFYFYGRDEGNEYESIPPLLHYYHYSEIGNKTLSVWGPALYKNSSEGGVFDLIPIFWHSWGKNESHTTLFPLFHYGYNGASNLLITPLFATSRGENGEKFFGTYVYARYRGRTELDMITPFYWAYRDPDIGLDRKLLIPFYYRATSPRTNDVAVFPLYAHLERKGISTQTWITPLFRTVTDLQGYETDLFPLFFVGKKNNSQHLVVAPFVWDFSSSHSRVTIVAPLYWRFANDQTVTQVALNTYYRERKVEGGTDWEFHFFPAFTYGQSPTGHWWNVLYGLAGYTREGTASKMRVLYIPFKLSE